MKKIKSQRGQSLVELSISLVLLLILLSGAVEFGMAFFQFVQLQDAAQEGALYGSMNATNCTNVVARVKGASDSPVDLNDTAVINGVNIVQIEVTIVDQATSTEYPCDGTPNLYDCEGNGMRVDVTYQHKIFMPFLPQILGRDILPLHASVTDTILSPFDCSDT
jgi:Flp pilus assembly protein TadG